MIQQRTIQTFFQRATLQYAGMGFVALVITSLGISFVLAREQMSTDLRDSARATVQAFRDRIIDGDVRFVEPQIREVLQIHDGESVQILNQDLSRVYDSFAQNEKVQSCPMVGESCYDSFFSKARILYPIALDTEGKSAYRYLFISRKVQLNWSFLLTIFVVFSIGYLGLALTFLRVSGLASGSLSDEIARWSARLQESPKESTPLGRPPFAELLPLKNAIEGLNNQIERYEKTATDKAKLLLLRGIAHDILTPVARLQLFLATLEHNIDKVKNAEVLADIQDSLKKVTNIASQVKALRDIELISENSDLVAAAADEVNALKDSEEIVAKAIKLDFKSDIPISFTSFSRTDVSRILSNLVQNAADASAKGSLVNVSIGSVDGKTFLSVEDRGCGIPEQSRGRVFDPDFTLKPATGTGLGLAIVKYICDKRSAKIELESELNRGTKITIRMPALSGGTNV